MVVLIALVLGIVAAVTKRLWVGIVAVVLALTTLIPVVNEVQAYDVKPLVEQKGGHYVMVVGRGPGVNPVYNYQVAGDDDMTQTEYLEIREPQPGQDPVVFQEDHTFISLGAWPLDFGNTSLVVLATEDQVRSNTQVQPDPVESTSAEATE